MTKLALRKRKKKMVHLFQEVEKEVVKARKRNFSLPPHHLPFANDKELKRKKTNEQSSPKEEAYGRKELIFHHEFFQIV
jgi:hypothetical protein